MLELEVLLIERDSVTCPAKLETSTDFKLETVDNECLSCGSVSEAQPVPYSNDHQMDLKTYQCAEKPVEPPLKDIFSSSDRVPLTAADSEDEPSQSYQGGSSSAEPVVESLSDNFDHERLDKSLSLSKYRSTGMYHCEDCSYESSKLNPFKMHRMIHTGVKPFACKQCLFTTVRNSDLKTHEITHSGVKPFACNQCSFTSAYKSALKGHELMHSGVKHLACNQCSYTTFRQDDLKAHERIHSGVKRFACNQCSYTTVRKGNLKVHERKHSGVKPFACKQCLYTTVYKGNLKRHEHKHL